MVLDLSNNTLTKLADEDFSAFPKLQALNLAHNRLRLIQGLGKVFDLKALNVDHNAIKSVKNIEHLVQLQVLKVSSNFISTISALRLLSLNKMLTHLDLDGNPVVETDERQKRKNIVHILNLMPMLHSLGSIPCASLHSKEKKKAMALQGLQGGDKSATAAGVAHGRALLDTNDLFPGFSALWITQACEILQCFQDVEVQRTNRSSSYSNDGDDDHWGGGSNDDESDGKHPRKPLNKKQQLQKDELRSRAVGYRSREKAMPSPPKVKTSVYSFGPPLPPPTANKVVKKKAPPADSKVVKQQQRRASELSAPKHQPVDKQLLSEEKKRKSRPMFDINMSVAERLLLAQKKAERRSSTVIGWKTMSSTGMQRTKSVANANGNRDVNGQTLLVQTPGSPSSISHSIVRSPGRGNQEVVTFRIEPLRSSTSPGKSSSVEKPTPSQQHPVDAGGTKQNSRSSSPNTKPLVFSVAPSPPKPDSKTVAGSNAKESTFLQDLAVTNFLSHAEEEFSTALTALNVLLSMSEKELSDTRKLAEYRSSLEALDILDERESHTMYARIQDYKEHHERGAECTQAFEQLGIVKKSMRQLLEKLETHDPGSSAIRAFCRSLRTNDLRAILNTSEADDDAEEERNDVKKTEIPPVVVPIETHKPSSPPSPERSTAASPATTAQSNTSASDTWDKGPEKDSPFSRESAAETPDVAEPVETPKLESDVVQLLDDVKEDEFDFLSSDKSIFDDDSNTNDDTLSATPPLDFLDADEKQSASPSHSPVPVSAYSPKLTTYTVTTDITEDIQRQDDIFSSDDTVDDAGTKQLEPEVDEDTPGLVTDPLETSPPDDDSDDAWLTTESSALDDLGSEAGGAEIVAADSSGDIFGDEEEQLQTEETQEVPASVATEAPANDFDDYAIDDFGSQAELEPNCTSDDHENQDVDAEVDVESTEIAQPGAENPLSEAEDADDEEAEMFGDWEKGFDPNTNHYFWFNHETGESAWTPPEGWPFEVDTPFEADEEYCAEEEGTQAETEEDAEYDDESAQETHEDQSQWECEGEQSAIESSQRSLSEFDDDLFSDQDLPAF